jgi:ubiquinone/menaquinone biosynthesis C-methylase UbiE
MGFGRDLALRMFGWPRGLPGRLGGIIMARTNRRHAAWGIGVLDVQPQDRVLEVGFGPGVAIEMLATRARYVAGADPSPEMLRQATRHNAAAIREGRVELHQAAADHLPFGDGSFDRVLAINSMQVWPDAIAGLSEISRVLRRGGVLALVFTVHSGQQREGVPELVSAAGFADARMVVGGGGFCLLAHAGG